MWLDDEDFYGGIKKITEFVSCRYLTPCVDTEIGSTPRVHHPAVPRANRPHLRFIFRDVDDDDDVLREWTKHALKELKQAVVKARVTNGGKFDPAVGEVIPGHLIKSRLRTAWTGFSPVLCNERRALVTLDRELKKESSR